MPDTWSDRLRLSDDDEDFQTDLALLGPYDDNNREIFDVTLGYGLGDGTSSDDLARLAAYDITRIKLLLGIRPGRHSDLGGAEGPGGVDYTIAGSLYQLGHATCFSLAETFAPRLMRPPGHFWATMYAVNGVGSHSNVDLIKGIDYLEITGSIDQFVEPLHRYREHEWDADLWPYDLLNIVLKREVDPDEDYQEELTEALKDLDPDFVRDYWLGRGALWVFVRPDKFPITEAYESTYELSHTAPAEAPASTGLERLPLDILLALTEYLPFTSTLNLFALSRSLRSKLIPSADALARRALPIWALPGPRGLAEWDAKIRSFGRPVPWVSYMRECKANSASMRNRERIWKIVRQIEALAVREGIIQ